MLLKFLFILLHFTEILLTFHVDENMHMTEDGTVEFWYARELMGCLGYTTWQRFAGIKFNT